MTTAESDTSWAQLEELLAEQAALRRVATFVARGADPGAVFARVCAEVGAVLGVQSTNLVRFEEHDTARVVGGWSVSGAPMFPVGEDVKLDGETAAAKVSRSGRTEWVEDYAEVDGKLAQRLRSLGIASSLAAPVTVAGRLWGTIIASSGRPREFGRDCGERIAAFAELVADALASADAREQLAASRARLVEAADSERRRLERNLHDGAQQRLVSLALDLRFVEDRLEEEPEAAKAALAAARAELALTLDELRELARGIHPAILSDRGLGPALETLAERAPMTVRIEVLPVSRRLPEPVEAAAYYLVAEALTNTAKHARASTAVVRVTREAGWARVEVSDDGVGGASLRNGSGPRGLADRVEAFGGRLQLESAPGQGTTLRGEIPLSADTAAAAAR